MQSNTLILIEAAFKTLPSVFSKKAFPSRGGSQFSFGRFRLPVFHLFPLTPLVISVPVLPNICDYRAQCVFKQKKNQTVHGLLKKTQTVHGLLVVGCPLKAGKQER